MLFANNDEIPYFVYLISYIYIYIGLFIYVFMFKACAFCIVTPRTLLDLPYFAAAWRNVCLSLDTFISKFITLTHG